MIEAVAFIALLAVLLGWYCLRMGVSRRVLGVAFVAFTLRIGFVLVDNVLRVFAGSGDAPAYERTLWFVAELWSAGVLDAPLHVFIGPGHGGYYEVLYSAILAPVYLLFGRSPVLVRLAMAFFGAVIVVNVALLARELLDERAALWAGTIAAVFPYWIQLNGVLYRDTLIVLLFSWMAYFAVRWQRQSDRRSLALFILAALIGIGLRLQNAPAVATFAALVVFTHYEPSVRQIATTAIAMVGSILLFVRRFGDELTVTELASRRRFLSRERPASYLTGWVYETIPELLLFAPIGVLYFLLVPFPWQAANALAVVAIVQNLLLWYPVVLLSVVGVRISLTDGMGPRATLPLLGFVLVGVLGYGIVEGNMGPAMRHRTQFQFVFVALAGVTLSRRVRVSIGEPSDQSHSSPSGSLS